MSGKQNKNAPTQCLDKLETRYFRGRSGSFDVAFFNRHLKSEFKHISRERRELTRTENLLYGLALVLFPMMIISFFMFTFFCYAFPQMCPFGQPPSSLFGELLRWWFLDDDYFKFLIPMSIPVIVLFVYFNWRSFQEFRHN